MKKKLLVVSAMLSIALVGCGQAKDLADDSTKKDLESLQADYDSLKTKYDDLYEDYGKLQADYDELKEKQAEQEITTEVEVSEPDDVITTEETPADLSGYASDVTYDQLARTPDEYEGKVIQMSGEVVQLMEDTDLNAIRVSTDDMYNDIIYAEYDPSITDERVLEDDNVTMYGTYYGIVQYESTLGQTISVPYMLLDHIEINK